MTAPDPDFPTGSPRKSTWGRPKIFSVFLLDLILPALLAGALVLLVFAYFRFWGLDRTWVLGLYSAAVIAAALLLSLLLNFIVPPFRTLFHKSRNRTFRRGILLLGGVIIPALFLLAGNVFLLPQGQTTMAALMSITARAVPTAPADDTGSLALQTQNSSIKILSIKVLEGFHSPEALGQLLRLAREDRAALQDATTRKALAAALASYGKDAKPALLNWFNSIDPAQTDAAWVGGEDVYSRYFSQPFESLKNEINGSAGDAAGKEARLAHLAAAQQQLQASIAGLESDPATAPDNARLDFVIQVFSQMDLKEDVELLSFAKTTAANQAYPSQVRGDALLLIAKLGSAKDQALLYPYIRSENAFLQARALQAIAFLQQKPVPASEKKTQ